MLLHGGFRPGSTDREPVALFSVNTGFHEHIPAPARARCGRVEVRGFPLAVFFPGHDGDRGLARLGVKSMVTSMSL